MSEASSMDSRSDDDEPWPTGPSVPFQKTSFSGGAYGLVSVSPSWLLKNVFGWGMVGPTVAIDGVINDIIEDEDSAVD